VTSETDKFEVDVVYALPHQQKIISVAVEPGTRFIEAVHLSQMVSFFPEIDLDTVKLGTFSRQVKHDDVIEPGQRVEIYRPLIADPKDVRRKRAEKAKDEGRINKITGAKVS
jgi:uncharacterized protein